jgi:uncharacterized protein YbjT (DUF2867 family)
MKLVIIASTGLIGSKLVTRLSERGHDAVAASPDTGVNTLTGEGLAEVLQGASVVVDVSNSRRSRTRRSWSSSRCPHAICSRPPALRA